MRVNTVLLETMQCYLKMSFDTKTEQNTKEIPDFAK